MTKQEEAEDPAQHSEAVGGDRVGRREAERPVQDRGQLAHLGGSVSRYSSGTSVVCAERAARESLLPHASCQRCDSLAARLASVRSPARSKAAASAM